MRTILCQLVIFWGMITSLPVAAADRGEIVLDKEINALIVGTGPNPPACRFNLARQLKKA